jgi:hypothetical protein
MVKVAHSAKSFQLELPCDVVGFEGYYFRHLFFVAVNLHKVASQLVALFFAEEATVGFIIDPLSIFLTRRNYVH